MILTGELEDLIRGYLCQRRTLDDLREWLLDHVQDVLDSTDPRLNELDGELWLLIAEYDRRDRDGSAGRALREVLAEHLAGDPVQHLLDRAAGDHPAARAPEQVVDGCFLIVAVAAEDLEGVVRHLEAGPVAGQLRQRRLQRT